MSVTGLFLLAAKRATQSPFMFLRGSKLKHWWLNMCECAYYVPIRTRQADMVVKYNTADMHDREQGLAFF